MMTVSKCQFMTKFIHRLSRSHYCNSSKKSTSQLRFLSYHRHESRSVNKYTFRSHNCGQLTKQDSGKRVTICGWVQYTRFNNKILAVRDSYGTIQCILDASCVSNQVSANLSNESVLKVSGIVKERPEKQKNIEIPTGDIEIIADDVVIMSEASKSLPILTRDYNQKSEDTRLRYRYLELRSKQMQDALKLRSNVTNSLRARLLELDFIECETPTLSNRTPGGANEYIVPTIYPDKYYSLSQSPQQYKQLLMVAGLDRYFQIARCYRDEAIRPDRQPEFTQLDIELSFTNQKLVMDLIDDLMKNLWSSLEKFDAESFGAYNVDKITFADAIKYYGIDKPDTRFDSKIYCDGDGTLAMDFLHTIPDAIINDVMSCAQNSVKQKTELTIEKGETKTIIRSRSCDLIAREFLGTVRKMMARQLDKIGIPIYTKQYSPIWVYDFPLFEAEKSSKLKAYHHPFTAPTIETQCFVDTDPLKVKGQHYDLVINGYEIAGGSIRVIDPSLQKKLFRLLGLEENLFGYFIEALNSGCPPHGGIAFGLDRLVATLMKKDSIKEVIAFPKSVAGRDVMTNCPENIGVDVKMRYNIN